MGNASTSFVPAAAAPMVSTTTAPASSSSLGPPVMHMKKKAVITPAPPPAPPASSSAAMICAICQETMRPGIPVTRFPTCRHAFHRHCIVSYAENCLRDRKVPMPCPIVPFDGSHLGEAQVYGHLSATSQDRYDRVKEEIRVANDDNLTFCRTPGCRGILTITTERREEATSRHEGRTGVICDKCGKELLLSTCPEDAVMESVALREGYRQCPKCGVYIHLEGGCKKMTCRCYAKFCIECGQLKDAKCDCESKYHSYLARPTGPGGGDESLVTIADALFSLPRPPPSSSSSSSSGVAADGQRRHGGRIYTGPASSSSPSPPPSEQPTGGRTRRSRSVINSSSSLGQRTRFIRWGAGGRETSSSSPSPSPTGGEPKKRAE